VEALRAGEEMLRARRVLVFVAHPDDAEWWIGGTLRRFVLEGAHVRLVVASDGEKGRNRIRAEDLRATRREEQRRAGEVLGYSEIIFWGLPDREVSLQAGLGALIAGELREYQPDLVITFDPRLPALPYLHPDHEGLGHRVFEVWDQLGKKPRLVFFHTRRPNVAVDITEVVEDKVKALLMHRSQNLGRGGGMNRQAHRSAGEMVGVPYAELLREVVR
jgi:LmbE family N-acetylglucosaminyl deacetylase